MHKWSADFAVWLALGTSARRLRGENRFDRMIQRSGRESS